MYFEFIGEFDIPLILDNQHGGINSQKFCEQITERNIRIGKCLANAEIEKWRNFYIEMHPQQKLNEEILSKNISEEDVKKTFQRFFKPLSADICPLTIIDPYIFANNTNIDLLSSILIDNVGSRKVRFITNLSNSNDTNKNDLIKKLYNAGFSISITNENNIHDRWWYTRIKGFSCGASFNGIKHKTTMLNIFSSKDLNDIINQFGV